MKSWSGSVLASSLARMSGSENTESAWWRCRLSSSWRSMAERISSGNCEW